MRAFLIVPALIGFAATAAVAESNRLNVPQQQWLSPAQVVEKLSAKGYNVVKIETDDGTYEVDVLDKSGVKIEAHVHPATGEILVGYDD